MKKTVFILFFAMVLLVPNLLAQTGLQKIEEYNQQKASFFLQNLSFFVAFIGGMISVLLPCTLAVLPAFFAYTFKEGKEITKMTLVFFAGFSLIFMALGIFAAAVGKSLALIQFADTKVLVVISGVFLIFFGALTILGKGFNFIRIDRKTGHDVFGVFAFGILFGLGWSACLGPILAGILLIASTFHNYIYSAALLFFYSLGLFVPLFLISMLFDRFNLTQVPFIKGKEFEVKLFGKTFFIHTTKIIAGILLIGTGMLFIIYNGTNVINSLDPLRTSVYAYLLEDRVFGIPYVDIIGLALLIAFGSFVGYFLYKRRNKAA